MDQHQAALRRAIFPPYFLGRPSGVYLRRFLRHGQRRTAAGPPEARRRGSGADEQP